jgi:hypothetical protein
VSSPAASTRRAPGAERQLRSGVGPLTFVRLKWVSFTHSCVYLALLISAFAVGKPEPLTFVLGWTHGLLWIGMSLACITAMRLRVVSMRLAVAVAVLGGIGPFFGSYEFVREQRRRTADGGGTPVCDDQVDAGGVPVDGTAADIVRTSSTDILGTS